MISNVCDRNKRICVVPVCQGERFEFVHKFPMETKRTLQWLDALGVPKLYNVPLDKLRKSYFVCSRHFRIQDYKNPVSRYLNKTAVPCLNLKSLDEINVVLERSHFRPKQLLVGFNNEETLSTEIGNGIIENNLKHQRLNDTEDDINNESNSAKLPNIVQFDEENFTISYGNENTDAWITDSEDIAELTVREDTNENKPNEEESYVIEDQIIESDEESFANQDENCKQNTVIMTTKTLKISLPNHSEVLSLDFIWLRDHCRCFLCFNYETNQRRLNILDIDMDTKPTLIDIKDNKLLINWDDGHQSEYDLNYLIEAQTEWEQKNSLKQILWDRNTIITGEYANVDFGEFVKDDELIKTILRSLITYGLAFIENVPPNQDMTEMAVRRLFPIQKTFFGEMWTFSDTVNKNHSDTAYTKEFLEAHTDNTYLCDAAGLQVFHCIEHNGKGGETFLVDGFKIVQDLMNQNYDAYQKLVEVNVPAEYIEDGRHHTYCAPIIRLSSETKKPEQIRFNLYDRATMNTIPQSEMREFYKHFRYFAKLIQTKENQWKFKLNPGTVLIFDNWRVLHGRNSYTGKRTMSGCYVSRTEFLSKARILDLIR